MIIINELLFQLVLNSMHKYQPRIHLVKQAMCISRDTRTRPWIVYFCFSWFSTRCTSTSLGSIFWNRPCVYVEILEPDLDLCIFISAGSQFDAQVPASDPSCETKRISGKCTYNRPGIGRVQNIHISGICVHRSHGLSEPAGECSIFQ